MQQHLENMPFVSFVSLTYNHAKFIEDTITGALSQDYPNMEIIISDDASPDGTYNVMTKYLREHPTNKNIILNCNEKNMGLVPHLNYVMQNFVHGDIIVLAGGDDISLSQRVSDTVKLFSDDKTIMMVTGQMERINALGERIEQVTPITDGAYHLNDEYIQSLTFMCGAPGMALRREVWDTFGPLLKKCPTEDSTLRFRAMLLGGIVVSSETYIKYRKHDHNLTGAIYKLSTKGIVAQYRKDLECAFEMGLVNLATQKRLERKIKCYALERTIASAKQGKPRWMRAPFKLAQLICHKIVRYV